MVFEWIKTLIRRKYTPLNRIEINKSQLINNYYSLSQVNNKLQIAPVFKSNAYGHGINKVALILDKLHPIFFCVDSLYEAYELLKLRVKTPILITGYVNAKNLSFKKLPFSYAVFSLEQLRSILRHQPLSKIHLFVDTGMNREGIRIDELENLLKQLTQNEKNTIEGVMSHLGYAENPNHPNTKIQMRNCYKTIKLLRQYAVYPKWVHFGNSSGLINHQLLKLDSYSNVNRVGLSLYDSALQLITHVAQVKKIKKGERVGYDFTYQTKKDGLLAVLPIGYNDGVDRRLSNIGVVKIKNCFCPIVGRISMNLMVVDVTNIGDIKLGDEVVIYSSNQKDKNSINNTANLCKTIPYEILIHLNPAIKRIIV